MCLILTAYKSHPEYPLIVLANRDEFHERPSQNAHWWEDEVLAGKDLKAGGTWLGVNRKQQFSALTNYRDPAGFRPDASSRGSLVVDFLKEGKDIIQYGSRHLDAVERFNDFNMLFYDEEVLYYYNSLDRIIEEVDAGVYGLSNHKLNTNWPKVKVGSSQLSDLIKKNSLTAEAGFDILSNKSLAKDEDLPETGVGVDKERLLSAMHIDYPGYGTRSSNIVFFKSDGTVEFYEKNHLTGESLEFKF